MFSWKLLMLIKIGVYTNECFITTAYQLDSAIQPREIYIRLISASSDNYRIQIVREKGR